jgi:flagellar hook-basal body complex protein FliE
VAFAMTLESIRDDMVNVEKRLDKYDSGTFTQKMEEDIIAQLKEMIEALKKAQQQMKDNKNQPSPPPGGQPPPQRLLDMIAELKLLRSLQMNVNKRTKDYHDQYADKREEQTDQVLLKGELENLAKRQQKVEQALVDIVKGKNR